MSKRGALFTLIVGLAAFIWTASLSPVEAQANNTPPDAVDDIFVMDEDTRLGGFTVLANDSDPDDDTLTVSLLDSVDNGQFGLQADGFFGFAPNDNFNGIDRFVYSISDGNGGTDTATVTIIVKPVNDPPSARPFEYITFMNEALTVPAPGLLSGSFDSEGDSFTAGKGSDPVNGAVVVNPDGSFVYTPNTDFIGEDFFEYTVTDTTGAQNGHLVTIRVNRTGNNQPIANDDDVATDEETPITIAVLANDSDPDGDSLTIFDLIPGPGFVDLNLDNTITYLPEGDFTGLSVLRYFVTDGNGGVDIATVRITVNPVNDPPSAGGFVEAIKNVPLTFDVRFMGFDPDGDLLTLVDLQPPTLGTVVDNGDRTVTYTPPLDFSGSDEFIFTIRDPAGAEAVGSMLISVLATNTLPEVFDDRFEGFVNRTLNIPAPGVLQNDFDPNGSPLTAMLVSNPANGTVTLNPDGSFRYRPDTDFLGLDSFTYTANDGMDDSIVVPVFINISLPNQLAVANDDAYATNENTTLSIPEPGVLANDTDAEGDALTTALLSGTTNGSLALNGDGSLTYTPDANFNGVDSFTYVVTAGSPVGSNVAAVTIAVNVLNNNPIAQPDAATTDEGFTVVIPVLANDSDPDGDPLMVSDFTQGSNGSVSLVADGLLYAPNTGFSGVDSFSYTASDSKGGFDTAQVTVTVNRVTPPEHPTAPPPPPPPRHDPPASETPPLDTSTPEPPHDDPPASEVPPLDESPTEAPHDAPTPEPPPTTLPVGDPDHG